MSQVHILKAVVPVLVDPAHKGTVKSILFSPGKAHSAVVIYEDAPPEFHDLRAAGIKPVMNDGDVVELNSQSRVDALRFRDAVSAVVYRPGRDELALGFGEGDCYINRFNPISGQRFESIYFENPVCLAYSSDGELLAAAGSDGTVTVFRIDLDDEAVELRSVQLPASARAMCFDELSGLLVVAAENNALIEFSYNSDEDAPVNRGVQFEDGSTINAMQLKALAYGDDGVIAYAGVGEEVFAASCLQRTGGAARLKETTRTHWLQFVENESVLVALTDGGVQILTFVLNEDRRPIFDSKVVHFRPIAPEMQMAGCRHYGSFICIASVLPPE